MRTIAYFVTFVAPKSGNARSFAKSSSPPWLTHTVSRQWIADGAVLTMTLLGAVFTIKSCGANHSASVACPSRGTMAFPIDRVARNRVGAVTLFSTTFSKDTLWTVQLAVISGVTFFTIAFPSNVMTVASVKTQTSFRTVDSKES